MARRELQEINAGSMADIAFLLLIFWLVTTTFNSDEGIPRQLPPVIEDVENPPIVKERNVYEVLVNARDELLVEKQRMSISELKDGAKEFLIANGDGLLNPHRPEMDDFPIKEQVRRVDVEATIAGYRQLLDEQSGNADALKQINKAIDKENNKLSAIKLLGGDYWQLPGAAIISMRNDKNTSYEMYIQVQNELESAVNELRDELAEAKFGMSFSEIKEAFEKDKTNAALKEKINAIRAVYPQRISEAEPKDAGNVY